MIATSGNWRNRRRTASGLRVVCLAVGLMLAAVSCTGPERDASANGVRGGTLRVLSAEPDVPLDTADTYGPIARAYARTLYGYNLAGPPEQSDRPGPRHRQRPPALGRPAHLHLHLAPRGPLRPPGRPRGHLPRLHHRHRAPLRQESPPYGQQFYADLIAGASRFGAGKASRISGLRALDARTLQITLDQPAGDFLSILTLSFFAPVPGEYAANYQVGANYSGYVVGSGPYKVAIYIPGETVVLDRNPHWDPATDPLRKAWVDRIQVKLDVGTSSIQRAIEREEADLSLDGHVPQTRVDRPPGRPRAVPAAVGPHHRDAAVPGPRDPPGGRGDR